MQNSIRCDNTRRTFLHTAIATAAAVVAAAAGPAADGPAAAQSTLGPDMAKAMAAFDRAETAWNVAQSDAELAKASAGWDAAVTNVARELPLSAADLRAKADVLRRVRAVEGDNYSSEHDYLLETLLEDIQAAGAA